LEFEDSVTAPPRPLSATLSSSRQLAAVCLSDQVILGIHASSASQIPFQLHRDTCKVEEFTGVTRKVSGGQGILLADVGMDYGGSVWT
jgi:hypothetical protein